MSDRINHSPAKRNLPAKVSPPQPLAVVTEHHQALTRWIAPLQRLDRVLQPFEGRCEEWSDSELATARKLAIRLPQMREVWDLLNQPAGPEQIAETAARIVARFPNLREADRRHLSAIISSDLSEERPTLAMLAGLDKEVSHASEFLSFKVVIDIVKQRRQRLRDYRKMITSSWLPRQIARHECALGLISDEEAAEREAQARAEANEPPEERMCYSWRQQKLVTVAEYQREEDEAQARFDAEVAR
jgi:hypothetical protein